MTPTTSTQVTQGLLEQYPNLKGIISPTTVGIAAAAAVLDTSKYRGKVLLTGLGTPDSDEEVRLRRHREGIRAVEPGRPRLPRRLRGRRTRLRQDQRLAAGQTFTAGKLGSFTVGADNTVLLGPPFVFSSANINQFNF